MFPTRVGVNKLLGLEEEAKNRCSRWQPWRPSWISDRHDFSFFMYKSPQCSPLSLESIGLLVQEKKRRIDFQDGGHFGFPIETILAISVLQVTPMLPLRYQVNWPRGVGGLGF